MYTLDTNAIIYYLKGDDAALPVLRDVFAQPVSIYVSAVTEVELFSFSQLSEAEIGKIEYVLQTTSVIPLDSQIARIAGLLRRRHHLKTSDAVIAATAVFTGTFLVTRNIRDFQKIPDLKLLKI